MLESQLGIHLAHFSDKIVRHNREHRIKEKQEIRTIISFIEEIKI